MKKRWIVPALAVLMVLTLSACKEESIRGRNENFGKGPKDIYIYNDLSVQDVMIDDFDMEKYDAEEYAEFLQLDIDDYNKTAAFVPQTAAEGEEDFTPHYTVPVSIVSCTAEENVLNQQLLYATAADFTAYNEEALEERGGYTLQAGRIINADTSVTEAELVDPDSKDGTPLDLNGILNGKDVDRYRYVICNFDAVIYGDGEIVGYTSSGVYDSDKDCVTVPAGKTVVVVYKQ